MNLADLPVDELVRIYETAAIQHANGTSAGDPRVTNKAHDLVAEVYRELKKRGDEARLSLLTLLKHPVEGVRGWAAAHCLEFAPELGRPVLEEIGEGSGIWSLIAQQTLAEWKSGSLKFP